MTEPQGWDGTTYNGGDTWMKENDPCPEGWRVPTAYEMASLIGATYGSEQMTMGPEKKFTWGWYLNHQGVYAGNVDSATATKDDFKGNIFMVYAGYRGHQVENNTAWMFGYQIEAHRVWRQTITRPDTHNWSRINVVFAWSENGGDWGTWWMDNPYALAIRPVADLAEAPANE